MRLIPAMLLGAFCVTAGLASAQEEAPPVVSLHVELLKPPPPSRPPMLMALYVGEVALQTFDGYSTIAGVRQGHREINPLIGPFADRPVAFWTVKALSTATSIVLTERLWRRQHRKEAVVLMIITDGMMTAVGARNAAILGWSR
jgi:uncharacterized protein DUF5658